MPPFSMKGEFTVSEKQDRQGARTAAELERRWNISERFAEVMGVATDARDNASASVAELDEKLTPDEIFNRLTNYGAMEGLYKDEDGQLYINASYIVAGILRSINGLTKFNLENGALTCADEFGQRVELASGMVSLRDNEGLLNFRLYALGGAGGMTFHSGKDEKIVGSFLATPDGLATSWRKLTLYDGNATAGHSFTVPNTSDYDLFAIYLGTDDITYATPILAYKTDNTVRGIGGWAGNPSQKNDLCFVSCTIDGNSWTLLEASKHSIADSGVMDELVQYNIKKIVGII